MWVNSGNKPSVEIDDGVFRRVLGMYPEEKLLERTVFKDALLNGFLKIKDLKSESEKILIPWQLFFLTKINLQSQMENIEKQREGKITPKLFAMRKGEGDTTSKRIIDRLIRQQNFLTSSVAFINNKYCGLLQGLNTKEAVQKILSHFEIDRTHLWRITSKGRALEYLIEKVEDKNLNVSRGVLANKLLPARQVVPSEVYRGASGFVIKSEKVPFLFLPSEINPDEVEGRQIYTLFYLLAIIGLEQYDHFLEKDKERVLSSEGIAGKLHNITTELLIPSSEVEIFRDEDITVVKRDEMCAKLKVTPAAFVTTLRKRGIVTKEKYENLLPAPYVSRGANKKVTAPKVSTSVKKFCGRNSIGAINREFQNKNLTAVQTQYLIWGSVNKKGFLKYRTEKKI